MHLHRLYGLVVAASRPLPAAPGSGPPDITIREHPTRRPSALPPNPKGYAYDVLANGDIHVSWSELFDFVVSHDGSHIDVYAEPEPGSEPVYTYLISQVISVALLQKGIESLHASAVELDGRGIALVGDSGYGKSTLTAALLREGARLVTDDLLVLRENVGKYDVVPGAFRLKLDPGTAGKLGVSWPGVPMADGSGKFVYLLDPLNCVTTNIPLDRILLLEPHATQPSIEAVSAAEATRALLAATFNPLHNEAVRLTRLLENAHGVARASRTERLHVPRDLDAIRNVIALI